MTNTVFFSWQADTPTKGGRNLVDRALERAIARVGADTSLEEAIRELEVDRDTKGVPGSPPIVETIFRKIDQAAVFVPDLTFVGQRLDGRPTPNPNVLIEYGWALKSLSYSRIVPVMNTAYGKPTAEAMPFDMRHLRNPILYHCPADADDATRRLVRDDLAKTLEAAIRAVLRSEDFQASLPKPTEPPPFPLKEPRDGPGRFRSPSEPLGIDENPLDRRTLSLAAGSPTWLRVMPTFDLGRVWTVAEIRMAMQKLMPLNRRWGGYGYLRGHDGFGVYGVLGPADETAGVVYGFTTGEIWTIDTFRVDALRSDKDHSGIVLDEKDFTAALEAYSECLSALGVKPPYKWIAGMQGIKHAGLWVPTRPGHIALGRGPRAMCMVDEVVVDGMHSPGEPPAQSLLPFFHRVYESCGLERPVWLDQESD